MASPNMVAACASPSAWNGKQNHLYAIRFDPQMMVEIKTPYCLDVSII